MSDTKVLIAYFMHKGHDTSTSKRVAEDFAKSLESQGYGSELFAITPVEEYPVDDKAKFEMVVKAEKSVRHRPAIVGKVGKFKEYVNVILVTPNWYNDMPMAVYTFFDEHDFSGRRLLPAVVHSGDGGKQIRDDLRHFVHKADVLPGVDIQDSEDDAAAVAEGIKQLLNAIDGKSAKA